MANGQAHRDSLKANHNGRRLTSGEMALAGKIFGSPRSLELYQAVLAKFLNNPLYAKDHMYPEDDEYAGD